MKCLVTTLDNWNNFHWKGHVENVLTPVFAWSPCLCLLKSPATLLFLKLSPEATFQPHFKSQQHLPMWVTPASKHYLFSASVLAYPSSSLVIASQSSHWSSLLMSIPSILVSQESFLFLLSLGDPTPYLFIFNCHLYVATLRSIFFCPLFFPGISLYS